jgi:uncharacterized protein
MVHRNINRQLHYYAAFNKIAGRCFMKNHKSKKLLSFIVLTLIITAVVSVYGALIPVNVASASEASATDTTVRLVYDKANLLSSDELSDLEEQCTTYGEDAGIEIMILTHNDASAVYAEDYIEDFEDQLPVGDRVFLLIDMYNHDVFIEGFGKAETYIHSKRIDVILDEIAPYLSDGYYYDACLTYIKSSAAYMKDDSELNYDHNYNKTPQSSNPNAPNYDETWPSDRDYSRNNPYDEAAKIITNVWVQLIIAIIIGVITVAIMAYNSGGKMTAGSNNYIDQGNSGLIGRRDDYIRTTVTRVRRPQNNNTGGHARGGFNAGGFRGGISSGGRSHSSGGRKF